MSSIDGAADKERQGWPYFYSTIEDSAPTQPTRGNQQVAISSVSLDIKVASAQYRTKQLVSVDHPTMFQQLQRLSRPGTTVLLALLAITPAAATTVLKLDDATFPDGRVEFRQGACDTVPALSLPDLKQMIPAQTQNYDLYLDAQHVELAYGVYFVYGFYVRSRHEGPDQGRVCNATIRAFPKDSFVDTFADVTFRVGDPANLESGTINMPLHNISYHKPILQSISPDSLYKIALRGQRSFDLRLVNLLPNLPVYLQSVVDANPENQNYWIIPPHAELHLGNQGQSQLDPGQSLEDGVKLTLQPNPWKALGASIFPPLGPKQTHDTVYLRLNFRTPGGVPSVFEIPVHLRFQPSGFSLVLGVLIGATIGTLLAWAIQGTVAAAGVVSKTYKKFLVGFGSSIAVELLGMILVAKDSEFRVLGLELDPYQMLPALCIGLVFGLASFLKADTILKWLKL